MCLGRLDGLLANLTFRIEIVRGRSLVQHRLLSGQHGHCPMRRIKEGPCTTIRAVLAAHHLQTSAELEERLGTRWIIRMLRLHRVRRWEEGDARVNNARVQGLHAFGFEQKGLHVRRDLSTIVLGRGEFARLLHKARESFH